jgi:hypothetical protein
MMFSNIRFKAKKKYIEFVCSWSLFYLLFVAFIITKEGVSEIDSKLISVSILLSILFSDIKQSISLKNDPLNKFQTYIIFGTIAFVLCIKIDPLENTLIKVIKISYLFMIVLLYLFVHSRIQANIKKKKEINDIDNVTIGPEIIYPMQREKIKRRKKKIKKKTEPDVIITDHKLETTPIDIVSPKIMEPAAIEKEVTFRQIIHDSEVYLCTQSLLNGVD